MLYTFRSVTEGCYACIPTYAIRSAKCTEVRVYDTHGRSKTISNALLKSLYAQHKLAIYTDENGKHYVPSKSYMKYV